jgi:hypothetical protein
MGYALKKALVTALRRLAAFIDLFAPLCRLLANARLNGTFAGNVPRSEEVFNRPQLHDTRQFSGLQQSC